MHTALVTLCCLMVSLEHLMFKTHNIQLKANWLLIYFLTEFLKRLWISTFLCHTAQLCPHANFFLLCGHTQKAKINAFSQFSFFFFWDMRISLLWIVINLLENCSKPKTIPRQGKSNSLPCRLYIKNVLRRVFQSLFLKNTCLADN